MWNRKWKVILGLMIGFTFLSLCAYQQARAETIEWEQSPSGNKIGITIRLEDGATIPIEITVGDTAIEVTLGDTPVYVRPYLGSTWDIGNWPSFFTDRNAYDTQLEQFIFNGTKLLVENTPADTDVYVTNFPSGFNIDNWPTGFLSYDTQLEQFKFTGNDLNVVFSNASIGATVSNWPVSYPVTGAFYPGTQPVSGTFWQTTQPISGAVTTSGTATVSGTVTANAGTNLNTSALSTETTLAKLVATTIVDTSLTVNPYTSVSSVTTNTKGYRITARTGIDVRVAFQTDDTSTNYIILHAGDTIKEDNIYVGTLTIKLMGNDAASSDTGTVSIVYKQ